MKDSRHGLQENGTYIFTRNNHDYILNVSSEKNDVTSSATTTQANESFTGEEKEKRMHWSGRPYKDVVLGDYYYDEYNFDGGYIAMADVILKDGVIDYVFLDERAPQDYYTSEWVNQTKRLSGYASFQADNERTNATLVTLVNSMMIVEEQVISENRLEGAFYSVKGSSNSVRKGFVPLLNAMAETIKEPSSLMYYGVTKDFSDGLYGELVVIIDKETNKIVEVRYDEFFADDREDITDENLRTFFRQSKKDSPKYRTMDPEFSENVDKLLEEIIEKQRLEVNVEDEVFGDNYESLLEKLKEVMN